MGASWQAFYAHLCAASIIRAMPETEIPPRYAGGGGGGDLYSLPASYSAGRRRATSEAAKNCAMIIENIALLCIAGSVHKLFAIHPRASVI